MTLENRARETVAGRKGRAVVRRRLTHAPEFVGLTKDTQAAAIRFPIPQGHLVLEIPVDQLSELLQIAAHSLEVSAASTKHPDGLPALPVFEWENGLSSGEQIALRLRIAGGGALVFVMSNDLASSLQDGLGEAIAYTLNGLRRPHERKTRRMRWSATLSNCSC